MTRHLIEVRTLSDWQSRLGNPERHWKRGASAMELAVAWTLAKRERRGLPIDVAKLLDEVDVLADANVEYAIPELRTPLPGGSTASQTDLWALLRNQQRAIGLSVEGKAFEPFAETVERWLRGLGPGRHPSKGRLERLAFISRKLGVDLSALGSLRYQLLHRTVACLLEAEKSHASAAVLLVQRFCRNPNSEADSWSDFQNFARLLQAEVRPGTLVRAVVPGAIPFYLGWLNCKVASDADLLAAMLDPPLENVVSQRNAFESLCLLANRESWCWRLTCTTCGCMHFRYGLAEISSGKHPLKRGWITRSGTNSGRLVAALGPMPNVPLPIDMQNAVIDIASKAELSTIATRARFPDWLGYLGVVLSFCHDAERDRRSLTRSWAPQLSEMLPLQSSLRQRLLAQVQGSNVLSLADLEAAEQETLSRRAN